MDGAGVRPMVIVVAEPAACLELGLGAAHARRDELFDTFLEVEAELLIHVARRPAPGEGEAENATRLAPPVE